MTLNNAYEQQNRGSQTAYQQYLAAMDAVSVEKVASASVFFNPAPGETIVDIGMASGTSSRILALLYPHSSIIGVDINPTMVDIARETYQLPNLEFRVDDGEKLTTFEPGTIGGFFNCSSIHHITSFNDYDSNRAYHTLKRQTELLKPGGIIVIRDFVKPPEQEVILELSNESVGTNPSDAELLISFAKTARSLAHPDEKGFPVRELSTQGKKRRFLLNYSDATEFVRRKDYYEHWEVELQEEYGYFTQKEFEDHFASLGLRVIVSYPVYNPWIVKNRYRGKFTIYDKNYHDLGFPPTNYIISGEKVIKKGTRISLVRHLPESQQPFLEYRSFLNTSTKKIYDVVERPNAVLDILPYAFREGRLEILAKHGYPRPLVNAKTDSPVIDQKQYSGYITEGITAGFHHNLHTILSERANIEPQDIATGEVSLKYFTSPGGIDEQVESHLIQLKKMPENDRIQNEKVSGFSDSGVIRRYDALQLIKTAQTGALVEARLELNIYNLLRKLSIPFPGWLGDKPEVEEVELTKISSLQELMAESGNEYVPVEDNAGYLQKYRAKFQEDGVSESSAILEYVSPREFSLNTLLTLPVAHFKGECYVGLEKRRLPVPQLQTGNSCLIVAPALRLSKDVATLKDLENTLENLKIYGSSIKSYHKLGEKFFPSAGVTSEQVYPYVVTLEKLTNELAWVKLEGLYQNAEMIRDGHLLITLFRLIHALGIHQDSVRL